MPPELRQTFALFRRELGEYFSSPVFYVVAAAFHFFAGAFFLQLLAEMAAYSADPYRRSAFRGELNLSQLVLTSLFDVTNFLFIIIVPLLTMRLLADERRSGTFELLVSTPTRDWALLLGKAGAAYTCALTLVASMLLYPAMAGRFGAVEWGLVGASLVGLALLTAAYVAVGLLASALTDNQMIAAVLAFVALLLLSMLGHFGPDDSSLLAEALRGLSFGQRTRRFYDGMVRGEDVLFLLLFTAAALFAAARVLESRRWRR